MSSLAHKMRVSVTLSLSDTVAMNLLHSVHYRTSTVKKYSCKFSLCTNHESMPTQNFVIVSYNICTVTVIKFVETIKP